MALHGSLANRRGDCAVNVGFFSLRFLSEVVSMESGWSFLCPSAVANGI